MPKYRLECYLRFTKKLKILTDLFRSYDFSSEVLLFPKKSLKNEVLFVKNSHKLSFKGKIPKIMSKNRGHFKLFKNIKFIIFPKKFAF